MSIPRQLGRPGATVFSLSALYAASHICYYALGIRFDITPLQWYWQYLDPQLLRHDLGRSLWYLHSQPPLFNLFLGSVLKLSGGAWPSVFHSLYLAFGYAFVMGLYALQRRLGVSNLLAFTTTTAYLFSPAFILYEHWLSYALPLATVGVWAVWFLHAAVSSRRGELWVVFFLLILVLCGTWHLFHLAFFVVVAAGAAAVAPGARRRVAVAALIPLALLAGWYGKNRILFGEFGASSWHGMVLWSMAARGLSYAESLRLEEAGVLTPVAFVPTFSSLEEYPPAYAEVPGRFRDVPALSRAVKSTGPPNFNHYGYIKVSRAYLSDFKYVLRRYPAAYARAVGRSCLTYCQSTADYEAGVAFLDENGNLSRVRDLIRIYDTVFLGRVPWAPAAGDDVIGGSERLTPRATYLTLTAALFLALLSGAVLFLDRGRAWGALPRPDRVVCAFMLLVVVYLAVVANATAWVETNRMRFQTDPYSLTLLVLGMQRVLRRRARQQFRH